MKLSPVMRRHRDVTFVAAGRGEGTAERDHHANGFGREAGRLAGDDAARGSSRRG